MAPTSSSSKKCRGQLRVRNYQLCAQSTFVWDLGDDLLALVLDTAGPTSLVRSAEVSTKWMEASYLARAGFRSLGDKPVLQQWKLLELFDVSVEQARAYLPYHEQNRRGGGFYRLFRLADCLPGLLRMYGGWAGMAQAQAAAKTKKEAKERRSADLRARRDSARLARQQALDAMVKRLTGVATLEILTENVKWHMQIHGITSPAAEPAVREVLECNTLKCPADKLVAAEAALAAWAQNNSTSELQSRTQAARESRNKWRSRHMNMKKKQSVAASGESA